jgi:hypothetical protein
MLAARRLSRLFVRSSLLPPGVVSFLALCFFVLVGRYCVFAQANLFGFFSFSVSLYERCCVFAQADLFGFFSFT